MRLGSRSSSARACDGEKMGPTNCVRGTIDFEVGEPELTPVRKMAEVLSQLQKQFC